MPKTKKTNKVTLVPPGSVYVEVTKAKWEDKGYDLNVYEDLHQVPEGKKVGRYELMEVGTKKSSNYLE
jgi:hypothetical protein